jgi:hypothetical protein
VAFLASASSMAARRRDMRRGSPVANW